MLGCFPGKYISDGKWCWLPGVCFTQPWKEKADLVMSCQRQADGFISKFLWSVVTWCCPGIFVLPWRLHGWVCAARPRPFSLNHHISTLRSLSHSFERVLVTEQLDTLMAFAFFHCVLMMKVDLLVLIQKLLFMASWATGLCTQVRFVY